MVRVVCVVGAGVIVVVGGGGGVMVVVVVAVVMAVDVDMCGVTCVAYCIVVVCQRCLWWRRLCCWGYRCCCW